MSLVLRQSWGLWVGGGKVRGETAAPASRAPGCSLLSPPRPEFGGADALTLKSIPATPGPAVWGPR